MPASPVSIQRSFRPRETIRRAAPALAHDDEPALPVRGPALIPATDATDLRPWVLPSDSNDGDQP